MNNNMLIHGFILVTIMSTAKSTEAEITMEAAFQGHCGHTSPCQQLCYEIHDGIYECDCIEGYELNKNGYSCQVINTTLASEGHSKSDEDILYQKGTSFSAKLAKNSDEHNNQLSPNYMSLTSLSASSSLSSIVPASIQDEGKEIDDDAGGFLNDNGFVHGADRNMFTSNKYYLSSEVINSSNDHEEYQYGELFHNGKSLPEMNITSKKQRDPRLGDIVKIDGALDVPSNKTNEANQPITASETTMLSSQALNTETMLPSGINEYDYYSKQDISIYDDINNNQLNMRLLLHNSYQDHNVSTLSVPKLNSISIEFQKDRHREDDKAISTEILLSTTGPIEHSKIFWHTNISVLTNTSDACDINCGTEGLCDNAEGNTRCLCSFGKTGESCGEDIKVRIPKFSNKSWIAFPALRGAYKHVQIRVEFRPESFDGVILLSGERDDLTGDFMALLLNKGSAEFWFDCGSGVGNVRSEETILLNEWNSVIIYRHRWDAWLVLNHGTKAQGRSNGLFSRITFREPVFLGGTGNITGLARRLPLSNGFFGCIRRFVANEHEYKFEEYPVGDVTKGCDIQNCITDKCFKYPCQHGGKCLPSDQGAVCLCPIGFVGDLCEIRMDLQVPAFNGSSFLRYVAIGDSALIWLELKVIMKPVHPDGLILYSGPEKYGDFIALSLNGGFVEFIFDLGSGPAIVRSESSIKCGQWHTIKVSRTARLAVLRVDQLPEVMMISSNGFWHLSLPGNLFVGGVDHVDKLPLDLRYKPFFVGCIQRIDINGHSLAIISEALGGANIVNCPHACVARPCGQLAECVPQMEDYECRCNSYNAEFNKDAEVPLKILQVNETSDKNNKAFDSKCDDRKESGIKKKKIQSYKPTKIHKHENLKYFLNGVKNSTLTTTIMPTGSATISSKFSDMEEYIPFHYTHGVHKNVENNHIIKQQRQNIKTQRNIDSKKRRDSLTIPKHNIDCYHPIHQYNYESKVDSHEKHTSMDSRSTNFKANPDSNILISDDDANDAVAKPNQVDIDINYKPADTDSKPFMVDDVLLDKKDKSLAENMRRILTNTNHQSRETEHPASYGDRKNRKIIMDKKTLIKQQTMAQIFTDWSLLKKLDLSADHRSNIGVRKNFGACFAGENSYFHYKDLETISQIISYNVDFNLRIKTHSDEGIILWIGRQGVTAGVDNDYLSLGIEKGYLHFRYNLGSGEVDIKCDMTKVSDGLWHRVRAISILQDGYLEVDGRKSLAHHAAGKLRQLKMDTGLYVGGMPDVSYFTRRRYNSGIVGCISEIVLAGDVKLNFDQNILGKAHNVETGIL